MVLSVRLVQPMAVQAFGKLAVGQAGLPGHHGIRLNVTVRRMSKELPRRLGLLEQ